MRTGFPWILGYRVCGMKKLVALRTVRPSHLKYHKEGDKNTKEEGTSKGWARQVIAAPLAPCPSPRVAVLR